MVPRHSKQRGSTHAGTSAIPRLNNTGARREAPDPGDDMATGDRGKSSGAGADGSRGSQPPRLNNTGARNRRARRSTDQRSNRASSAGGVRKDGTGANRMTGVVHRDSAQRRSNDKHRSDARNFLTHPPSLVPTGPASCRARFCPSIARSPTGGTPYFASKRRLSTAFPRRSPPKSRPTVASFPKTRAKYRIGQLCRASQRPRSPA